MTNIKEAGYRQTLDRDGYMKPSEDQRIERYIWKLKKPLYGLDNTSMESFGYNLNI